MNEEVHFCKAAKFFLKKNAPNYPRFLQPLKEPHGELDAAAHKACPKDLVYTAEVLHVPAPSCTFAAAAKPHLRPTTLQFARLNETRQEKRNRKWESRVGGRMNAKGARLGARPQCARAALSLLRPRGPAGKRERKRGKARAQREEPGSGCREPVEDSEVSGPGEAGELAEERRVRPARPPRASPGAPPPGSGGAPWWLLAWRLRGCHASPALRPAPSPRSPAKQALPARGGGCLELLALAGHPSCQPQGCGWEVQRLCSAMPRAEQGGQARS